MPCFSQAKKHTHYHRKLLCISHPYKKASLLGHYQKLFGATITRLYLIRVPSFPTMLNNFLIKVMQHKDLFSIFYSQGGSYRKQAFSPFRYDIKYELCVRLYRPTVNTRVKAIFTAEDDCVFCRFYWNITPKLRMDINAANILNTIGLTEGDPRSGLTSVNAQTFYARPILGRSATVSLQFFF